jgi:HPt (histidine-containing phosphotransfer) domain-containing protein
MPDAEIKLDTAAIAALRALQIPGRPSIILRIVDLFETSATALVGELEQALDDGDLAVATRAAHTLKSSSANIGASDLATQARHIEQCGRDGDLAACRTAAEPLHTLLMGTLAAVAALRCSETA